MDRPFFHSSIQHLEELVGENRSRPAILGQIWSELTYRDTDRAKQLMREVKALLDGTVPGVAVADDPEPIARRVGIAKGDPLLRDPDETEAEEPAGLEEDRSAGWGDYPLDAVFVRTETRSVSEVVKRIEAGRYVLDPDFQRDFVWPGPKQSKLIESCVMRIPLPVFYVAEAPDGRIIVVDGLQRLTTFARFLNNHLRLTGLAASQTAASAHVLEGKVFRDLPLNLQERVQDTQLTMYILDAKAPERARLDIFERVNSGEPLSRQQMRNALYNGKATVWLRDAAAGEPFRRATGASLSAKTMRDREAINRFCAFELVGWRGYTTSDMDTFLADGLSRLASISEGDRSELRERFDHSMELNRQLFDGHSFRKSLALGSPMAHRSVINVSLFEVCAVGMASPRVLVCADERRDRVKTAIIKLLGDEDFVRAITYSTNSTAAVHTRFGMMEAAMQAAVEP